MPYMKPIGRSQPLFSGSETPGDLAPSVAAGINSEAAVTRRTRLTEIQIEEAREQQEERARERHKQWRPAKQVLADLEPFEQLLAVCFEARDEWQESRTRYLDAETVECVAGLLASLEFGDRVWELRGLYIESDKFCQRLDQRRRDKYPFDSIRTALADYPQLVIDFLDQLQLACELIRRISSRPQAKQLETFEALKAQGCSDEHIARHWGWMTEQRDGRMVPDIHRVRRYSWDPTSDTPPTSKPTEGIRTPWDADGMTCAKLTEIVRKLEAEKPEDD